MSHYPFVPCSARILGLGKVAEGLEKRLVLSQV